MKIRKNKGYPVKILLVAEPEIYFIGSHNEIRVFTLTSEILNNLRERDRIYI